MEHPIFNQSNFFIPTKQIESLKDELECWLSNGSTGGVILGAPRQGKSKAIKHLSEGLKNRCSELIPSAYISIKPRDTSTVTSVFKNLAYSLDIPFKARATSDELSNQVCHHLGDMAVKNKTNQVVLFVDEVQRLKAQQLEAFAEVFDELNFVGINLSVFFIGNDVESEGLISQIKNYKNELIRGRFFTLFCEFEGLKNIAELRFCLNKYDSVKFKAVENKTVIEFFLPELHKQGWKIENLAEIIWDVFIEEYKKKLKISSWGMQYFTTAMRALIVDYLPQYGLQDDETMKQMIEESMKVSGLISSSIQLSQI